MMRSKLNEGYQKMVLTGIEAVCLNDEPIALRGPNAVLFNIVYREMVLDKNGIHPEEAFTNGWYNLRCPNEGQVEQAMTNLCNWACAYRDRMIDAGADEDAYAISIKKDGRISDLGRIEPVKNC